MRYHALACDYDGTIARHGDVDEATLKSLKRVRDSGRKLILVTGRELPDLCRIFPRPEIFDLIVAENGGLLYRPENRESKALCPRPPAEFVDALSARGIHPLSVGETIVATHEPNEGIVLETIRQLGLELQVIFNKGAVMVLPSGVNKATGLKQALSRVGLSRHNVVGVGDAENDHAFLEYCECSAAVANALPSLKERVDFVSAQTHGPGVSELIDLLVGEDLVSLEDRLSRHDLLLGHRKDGSELRLKPFGRNLFLCGSSGGGKSTFVRSLFERMVESCYQTLVIDPEGDYEGLPNATFLGDGHRPPRVDEILSSLEQPDSNTIVNLMGLKLEERSGFFQQLVLKLSEMRARTSRPHWIICDETHHLMPADRKASVQTLSFADKGFVFVTVDAGHVAPSVVPAVDLVLVGGKSAAKSMKAFCQARGCRSPLPGDMSLATGELVAWFLTNHHEPVVFDSIPPKSVHRRHVRKYMQGELSPADSFYFRGPEEKLNLRAHNLETFLSLADGIDSETWLFHLNRGDLSRWFSEHLNDDELAEAIVAIEGKSRDAAESKARVRAEIERRYTAAE